MLLSPGGEEIPLRRKSFDLLRTFVANAGRVLDRDSLHQAVWPHVTVTDDGITQCVREIRLALGDDARCMIRTVPRRGYVFAVDLASQSQQADLPAELALPIPPAPALCEAPRLSLVVLPFQNRSGDQQQGYLADGITEDLTTDMSHLPGAFVIARGSAYSYQGKTMDVRQIGQELGVRYVLEGGVRRLGDRLRVNAQLSSAETGTQLWADRFDRPLRDLGAMQDEIVARLRSVLNVKLIDFEGGRSARERPENPDAYDLILRARSLHHQPATRERNQTIRAL